MLNPKNTYEVLSLVVNGKNHTSQLWLLTTQIKYFSLLNESKEDVKS